MEYLAGPKNTKKEWRPLQKIFLSPGERGNMRKRLINARWFGEWVWQAFRFLLQYHTGNKYFQKSKWFLFPEFDCLNGFDSQLYWTVILSEWKSKVAEKSEKPQSWNVWNTFVMFLAKKTLKMGYDLTTPMSICEAWLARWNLWLEVLIFPIRSASQKTLIILLSKVPLID